MKRILIIGGANGIGLSIAVEMAAKDDCEIVYVVDKQEFPKDHAHSKIVSFTFDLTSADYSFFDRFTDVDALMITAGLGSLNLFKNVSEKHIIDSFSVNSVAPIRIVHRFMDRLAGENDFYCGIMVSISGFMSSPFFAVYGATKAALKIFIESVNVELEKSGSINRILNVSPGSINGTAFNHGKTDLNLTQPLANDIICHLQSKDDLFIPKYDEVFKEVLERYHTDFREEGRHSYEYKLGSGRVKTE